MRYILSIMLVMFLFGCEDKMQESGSVATVSDTTKLQPDVADASMKPPVPPSI